MLQRWLDRLWHSKLIWRWIGEPLRDRKYSPWAGFSADTRTPIVTDPNQFECHTRHSVAVVYWNCSRGTAPSPLRAKNALLPDGTRGMVQSRTVPWWRRKGSGDKIWIMGDVDIRADDVVFVDRASQDLRYDPPAVEIGAQLERDLALHRPFVEALADDKFATVAHHMLAHLEWMRTGTREIGLFEGLHHMFACLRNKGEDYLDFKFGDYPGVAPTKAEAAQHVLRMKEMMRSLGWRTYTADELQARVREDFRAGSNVASKHGGSLTRTKRGRPAAMMCSQRPRSSQTCCCMRVTIRSGSLSYGARSGWQRPRNLSND
jgi:hypothetical protein